MRAKFTCTEVSKRIGYSQAGTFVYAAKLTPVISGSEENRQFYALTPWGTIELGTIRENFFQPGKEYFVDFTVAGEA